MKRIVLTALVAAAAATGCTNGGQRLNNAIDPCWPERYNHEARLATLQPFQAQAANGAVMGQTVWNYHFEQSEDVLTRAGMETLDQFITRRPSPDTRVYLQTTRDIGYDAATPEKYADTRRDLDERRAKAIQKYLAAQTASRPTNFEVQVIDPANPAISARYAVNAINALPGQYRASIGGGSGGGGGAGGNGATGGGGGGGGSGR